MYELQRLELDWAKVIFLPPGRRVAKGNPEVYPEGGGSGEETMNRKYAVIFEQAETNWAVYVPDLPGCVTTGRALDETERNIRQAISGTSRLYGILVKPFASQPVSQGRLK